VPLGISSGGISATLMDAGNWTADLSWLAAVAAIANSKRQRTPHQVVMSLIRI